MATAYLSLGTNLGDKTNNLKAAVSIIEKRIGKIISQSAFFQTEPWGFESSNQFLNAVICIECKSSPEDLLHQTQEIEKTIGRLQKSNGLYSDRIIDIDILYYDNLCINTEELTIPHPLLHLRDFVLEPLNEIASDITHPILNKTTRELLLELKKASK